MAQSDKDTTVDLLQSFADAFNAHDIKKIMSHMTLDCVFEASSGPDFDGKNLRDKRKLKRHLKMFLIHFLMLIG